MKKITLLLFFTSIAFSQQKVAQQVADLQTQQKAFERQELFSSEVIPQKGYADVVEKATFFNVDSNKLSGLVSAQPETISLQVPYQSEIIEVLLYKTKIQADGFHVDTDKTRNIALEKSVHYRGIIRNDLNSLVSINIFNSEINGIISSEKYGNLTLGKIKNDTNYIVYSDRDLVSVPEFNCNPSPELPHLLPEQQNITMTNNCVTVYFEIDYDLYQANGSDLAQTTIWTNSVFNNVQTLFNNDNIKTALKSVFIWTSPDPYSGANIYQYLDSFHANRPVFDGDVGQLLTVGTGFGGVAAKVNGLCSTSNYLYSDIYLAFSNVPAYSWTVQSITHELGHIMGSEHTHDCVWNGNNTPIDGCGPSIGYAGLTPQGTTCNQTAPNPTSGTIMSYCYAVAGVGNNFANGFGEQPTARIAQRVDAATCLGTDCTNTCLVSVNNLVISDVSFTSATLSWSTTNSSTTAWEIAIAPYPFLPTTWTTYNSLNTTYVAENLQPNTYYRFFVRNNCGNLVGASVGTAIISTLDDFCDSKLFTDTSGINNNYEDYQNWTRTIFPSQSGMALKVTFNSIDIEAGYDFLHIHSGPSTNDSELVVGGITGNTVVGPFTSTHPSGALTFRFVSDTNTNGAGWNATTSCEPLNVDKNDLIDFSYFPNPVKDEINISSKSEITAISIFSIDGKLLYQNNLKATTTKINMSVYTSGTYLFKLDFSGKPVTFKVLK